MHMCADACCLLGQHAKVLRIALRLLKLISGTEQFFPYSALRAPALAILLLGWARKWPSVPLVGV